MFDGVDAVFSHKLDGKAANPITWTASTR